MTAGEDLGFLTYFGGPSEFTRTDYLDAGVAAATLPRVPKVQVVAELRCSPGAPANRGSCLRHSHVRGSEPQFVYSQKVAPNLERYLDCPIAKR